MPRRGEQGRPTATLSPVAVEGKVFAGGPHACDVSIGPDILPEGALLFSDGRTVRDVERPIRDVLRTGELVRDTGYQSTAPVDPHRQRLWSLSYFRLHDDAGRAIGMCEVGSGVTEAEAVVLPPDTTNAAAANAVMRAWFILHTLQKTVSFRSGLRAPNEMRLGRVFPLGDSVGWA
ncbi:hypothetical protein GCM10010421_39020 [Streptomyces glaucus]|uniref:PAS fold-4 domain-containing protein n=1 Tax=Streptomyces glaucus TaxID=284029 RepID=A0ABN3K1H6_9ACTN